MKWSGKPFRLQSQKENLWTSLPSPNSMARENGIITEDVYEVLSLQGSVAARNHFGGTAPEQVREAIARAMKTP